MNRIALNISAFIATAVLAGCGTHESRILSEGGPMAPREAGALKSVPTFPRNPNEFVAELSNPYQGFRRGKILRYQGTTPEGVETIVVEVTNETKMILGVATTVVRDRAYLDGNLIEDTYDWYAQDRRGNVWYFGEDSKAIENGVVVSTEGSWEAGVNGAKAGIAMLAQPESGMSYRLEFLAGVAEDMAKILGGGKRVDTRARSFNNCLKTREWSDLSPGDEEIKSYAPGVGLIQVIEKGSEPMELVSVQN